MRKAESPFGQWALRLIAAFIAFVQGAFLFLYALAPSDPSFHKTVFVFCLELIATAFALAVLPTFLICLSLPDEMDRGTKRLILIVAGFGIPLVTYFVVYRCVMRC